MFGAEGADGGVWSTVKANAVDAGLTLPPESVTVAVTE
jgi:hypothetical protein